MTDDEKRLTEPLEPKVVSTPATYSRKADGPKRRAELRTPDGVLLGWVWTDGKEAAGFRADEKAGAAGVQAAGTVWGVMKRLCEEGVPAGEVLDDPAPYEPVGALGEPSTPEPDA